MSAVTTVSVLDRTDARRPRLLDDLDDLGRVWWKGELEPTADLAAIGIVGTRHPTPYGQRIARKLAEGCARAGYVVVSGLAMGVDAAAHLGALDAPGGRTIAVMANGIDIVHPRANRSLAERIEGSGALVTTYPPGTPPYKSRFLERNTVIAALSRAVVVIEGEHPSSGALSTAKRAHELGREILAVPGMISVPQASGPNMLIRDGVAPCLDVRDLLDAAALFQPGKRNEPLAHKERVAEVGNLVTDNGARVLDALSGGPLDAAALAAMIRRSAAETALELLDLETAGLVRRTMLGEYERLE